MNTFWKCYLIPRSAAFFCLRSLEPHILINFLLVRINLFLSYRNTFSVSRFLLQKMNMLLPWKGSRWKRFRTSVLSRGICLRKSVALQARKMCSVLSMNRRIIAAWEPASHGSARLDLHMIGNINPCVLTEDHDPVIGCLIASRRGCAARKHFCKMGLFILFSDIHWKSSLVILFSRRSIAECGRVEKTGVLHTTYLKIRSILAPNHLKIYRLNRTL